MRLQQTYDGCAEYLYAYEAGPYTLLVGVPCSVGNEDDHDVGLLDTAAEWSILRPDIATTLGLLDRPVGPALRLASRLGTFDGTLERAELTLPAAEGRDVTIDVTWFVSEDWTGPLVLGWTGCLDRLRFALDPTEDAFYFGEP